VIACPTLSYPQQCSQPCVAPCPVQCPTPCPTQCPIQCPTPTPTCPTVTFISDLNTAVVVPINGTPIVPGSTIIPATITVVNGFLGVPTTNIGGISQNGGFFTIPIAGRYIITTDICFAAPTLPVTATDTREVYIYRIDATTGIITLLAVDTRTPVSGTPTCINVATVADLHSGDRIFIAAIARQPITSGATVTITSGRLAITRVC